MKAIIFVVETKNPSISELEFLKEQLINEFGGLTEQDFKGYWKNEKGKIETDFGKLWIIYGYGNDFAEILTDYAKRIKKITAQSEQALEIDGKLILA